MAQLEVKLDEVKDAQEEAVRDEDYTKAEELKQQVTQIRAKIDKLKDEFYEKRASVTQNLTIVEADADDVDDEVFVVRYDLKIRTIRWELTV